MYEKFIAEANLNPDNFSDAWAFGNTPQMADELLELVLEGKKELQQAHCPCMDQTIFYLLWMEDMRFYSMAKEIHEPRFKQARSILLSLIR